MTLPQVEPVLVMADAEKLDLTAVFHRVNNLLPEDQKLLHIAFDTTVAHALKLMKERNFSQLPVLAGNEVLGVFNYRSFTNKLSEFDGEKVDFGQLRVGDFIEDSEFIGVLEDWNKILNPLDKKDFILIGTRDMLVGVLTPIDLIKYLYKHFMPFILLSEIELALRNIISACATHEQLLNMINLTLSRIYQAGVMPTSLEEMTFNDYIQLVGDGRSWENFEIAFGQGDWQRKRTRAKLEEIRDLRNDTFHFRRELEVVDTEKLMVHRDWIKNVLTAYQAKMVGR